MSSQDNTVVGASSGSNISRVVLPILNGTVEGPHVFGTIVERSGADWAEKIIERQSMRLDARYTLKTNGDHYIYVRSEGVFNAKPGGALPEDSVNTITQEDVDWFARLQFEASDPYDWMNDIFAIGVLTEKESRICIDAYQLTNFLGPGA